MPAAGADALRAGRSAARGAGEERDGRALRWQLRVDGASPGAQNMALDHALALAVDSELPGDAAILRLYRWDRPTVSFGRNQTARGLYDRERAAREGVAFVRRPSGGRAVLHHDELTYAVAMPLDAHGGLRRTYHRINEALVAGLRILGIPAALAAPGRRSLSPDSGPCFREPAAGEVVVGGSPAGPAPADGSGSAVRAPLKVAGSAQLRIGRTILQHGALPLSGSQALLEALLLPGGRTPGVGPARASGEARRTGTAGGGGGGGSSLSAILGRELPWDDVSSAIERGFRAVFRGEWRPLEDALPRPALARRLRVHYESSDWTWRK